MEGEEKKGRGIALHILVDCWHGLVCSVTSQIAATLLPNIVRLACLIIQRTTKMNYCMRSRDRVLTFPLKVNIV